VPQDMKYQDDSQHLYINLKQGEQRLNGAQAVQFLRFRYDANGDIGRVQRQQTFIRALKEQALKPTTLARLPQILSVIQANLDTNLNVEELIALAGFGSQIDRSKMQMLMLPGTFSAEGEYAASYWLPNQPQIARLVRQYFGITSPHFSESEVGASDHVTIAIQDSTTTVESVEKLMNRLGSMGYGDIFVDEPWSELLTTTQIIAQHGNGDEATAIQQSLGFGEVLVESTGSLQSDITIRLGKDALEAVTPVEVTPGEVTPGETTPAELGPDASPNASSSASPSTSPLSQSAATPAISTPQSQPTPQPVPTKANLPVQPLESTLQPHSVPASSPALSLEASPVAPGALPASIETIPATPEISPDAGSLEE
jgi:polyisoprenyl-teichoic acid--peptidoglycan teichoic acid transferase